MNRNLKRVAAAAALGLGSLLMLALLFGGMARARGLAMMDGRHTAVASGAEIDSDGFPDRADMIHSRGFDHGRPGFGGPGFFLAAPLMFLGGLLRLALLGLLLVLLLRLWKRRPWQRGGTPEPRQVAVDVADEIRVGDEVGQQPAGAGAAGDDLTADDLLQAMKRLGIRKLEL